MEFFIPKFLAEILGQFFALNYALFPQCFIIGPSKIFQLKFFVDFSSSLIINLGVSGQFDLSASGCINFDAPPKNEINTDVNWYFLIKEFIKK